MHDEQLIIAAFVQRSKRNRYREILANPRSRRKFIGLLAHFKDFDPAYRVPVAGTKLGVHDILRELQKRHSPAVAYAISEDPSIDQKELPLADALQQTVGRGIGTVLSCIPGRLAFVETEDERFILERTNPLERPEFVRFVREWKDGEARIERGVFHVVAQALEWHQITGSDAKELKDLLGWFDTNLTRPASVERDKLRHGVCWFKTTATEHIGRIREIVGVLERNGIRMTTIKTDTPGYVMYEDEWQLVADAGNMPAMPKRK